MFCRLPVHRERSSDLKEALVSHVLPAFLHVARFIKLENLQDLSWLPWVDLHGGHVWLGAVAYVAAAYVVGMHHVPEAPEGNEVNEGDAKVKN